MLSKQNTKLGQIECCIHFPEFHLNWSPLLPKMMNENPLTFIIPNQELIELERSTAQKLIDFLKPSVYYQKPFSRPVITSISLNLTLPKNINTGSVRLVRKDCYLKKMDIKNLVTWSTAVITAKITDNRQTLIFSINTKCKLQRATSLYLESPNRWGVQINGSSFQCQFYFEAHLLRW